MSLKKRRLILLGCGSLMLLIGLIFLNSHLINLKADEGAKDGSPLIEGLQNKIDTNQFRFQILTEPSFQQGKGEIMIGNPSNNPYDLSVKIRLERTQEELYASEVLSPGERIREITLVKELAQGIYPGIARFSIIDKENQSEIGVVEAALEIKVLE